MRRSEISRRFWLSSRARRSEVKELLGLWEGRSEVRWAKLGGRLVSYYLLREKRLLD